MPDTLSARSHVNKPTQLYSLKDKWVRKTKKCHFTKCYEHLLSISMLDEIAIGLHLGKMRMSNPSGRSLKCRQYVLYWQAKSSNGGQGVTL